MIKGRSRSVTPTSGGAGYWWYLVPGFVLVALVIVVPLGQNVYYSFTFYRGIRPPQWIGLANWQHLLHDDKFWQSFVNSIAMIVAMVVVPTVVGLVIASLLFDLVGKRFGGKVASFLRATYYVPQIIPIVVAAIVIGWIARPQDGALNEMLGAVGLDSWKQNWLGDPTWALPTIMMVLIWVQIGYPIVVFMAALQRVDPELYEAAELDGANWWNRFRAITVAVIRPEIFVVTLTCTIAALKVFAPVYALTRGGPGTSTIVPSYYSYSEFFQSQQVGYGATVSTALTVVIVLVATAFLIVQRRVERQEEQR
jgi:raffinose/stachyose/melibiose transport system permease protein